MCPRLANVFPRFVSSMPLSENRGSLSATPYRVPYCESLLQRWFSLPAGQSLEVSLSRQSDGLSSLLPAFFSWITMPLLQSPLSTTQRSSLIQTKAILCSVDSFIRQFKAWAMFTSNITLTRKRITSRIGHTLQWLSI